MKMQPQRPLAGPFALASALVLASPGAAEAQTAPNRMATAQGLYESAAELIKAGKLAEACPKLEESQRLDPAMGTQFFLAGCYESTGRPTSAWSLFVDVASAARAAGNTVRESTARARAAALEPRLPRITVAVAEATAALPGLVVTRDGAALKPVVWNTAIPVDLGEHTVRVSAPGKAPWETTVTVRELGQKLQVKVPPLQDGAAGDTAARPSTPSTQAGASTDTEPAAPGRPGGEPQTPGLPGRRVAALLTGSAGVAGLAVGGVLGLLARSAWSDADAGCPTHLACSPAAHDQSKRSLTLAAGSTGAFAAGGAAVAGALVLWFTTPPSRSTARLRVVPAAGAGTAGVFAMGAL